MNMAQGDLISTKTLFWLGIGAAALYLFGRAQGGFSLFGSGSSAGAGAGGSWAQQAAIADYLAARGIVNSVWPAATPGNPGAMAPAGFAPPSSSPAYAAWLAEAAGQGAPGTIPGTTPTGGLFNQFATPTPAAGSPYAFPN
jgi:hypothetical protein